MFVFVKKYISLQNTENHIMKTSLKLFGSMLLSAAVFTACGDKDPVKGDDVTPDAGNSDFEYLFALNCPQIISEDEVFFAEGDSLGLSVVGQDLALNTASEVSVSEGGAKITLKFEGPRGLSSGDKVLAYSPYIYKGVSQNVSEITMTIPAVQHQDGDSFYLYQFPLVAAPFVAGGTVGSGLNMIAGELQMHPLYSVARFDIAFASAEYSGQAIKSITWYSKCLSGDFTIDLTSSEYELPALNGNTVTTEVAGLHVPETGGSVCIYAAVAPGTHSGELTIETDKVKTAVALNETEFKRGVMTEVKVTVPENPEEPEQPVDPEEPEEPEQPVVPEEPDLDIDDSTESFDPLTPMDWQR